jgi:hypothetical protein
MVKPNSLSYFKTSTFSNDILGYKNLTQNALNKKILKWKNQLNKYTCMDKYACKYYIKKEFKTDDRLIWLLYLYFIKINLFIVEGFYKIQKIECDFINKQQHTIYLKQQIICECGGKYTHRNKQAHLKTQKHINKD